MKQQSFYKKVALVSVAVFLSACGAGKNKTNVEVFQDMMDQRSLKSQDYDYLQDRPSFLVPPEGTVPRGYTPYKYSGNLAGAEASLMMPSRIQGAEIEARGAQKYQIYCGVCHGVKGLGDGPVAQYMPIKPPAMNSDRVLALRDGRIYHVIVEGYGVMGSYGSQVRNEDDRWAIVKYVRKLQGR
jgi:mono/diheme cytochrome c family protein